MLPAVCVREAHGPGARILPEIVSRGHVLKFTVSMLSVLRFGECFLRVQLTI